MLRPPRWLMAVAERPRRPLRFHPFELDTRSGELRKQPPGPAPGEAAAAVGIAAGAPRRRRDARGSAPAALVRRHVRGLRRRPEHRRQQAANGIGRLRGAAAVRRDVGAPWLSLHRRSGAGRRGRDARAGHRSRAAIARIGADAGRRRTRGRSPLAIPHPCGLPAPEAGVGRPPLERHGEPTRPITGRAAPGQPHRRSAAGVLRGRHDGRAHHGPRLDPVPPRDLASVRDEVQGQPRFHARDRAPARRGRDHRWNRRPQRRTRSGHRPAGARRHRSPPVGSELRARAVGTGCT